MWPPGARSRGRSGEGSGPSPRGRMSGWGPWERDWGPGPGQLMEGAGPSLRCSCGEGSRGRCGEGARCSPRGRMRTRCSCGEGCVEDTRRCSCTDHWQVQDHESECSAGPTHGGSRREATWKLGAVGSLRTPRRAIRLARQTHHACSMQQVACNVLRATDMQQKCKFLHARDDSMSAAMHRAVSRLSANATPKPSQGRTNERTMADSGMSVNLAPEAVVATTSGAGG
jgi:hypothetical protein